MNRLARLAMLLLAVAAPHAARAAESGSMGTLTYVLENDLFDNVDRHYTNGLRWIWVPAPDVPAPGWSLKLAQQVPWFPRSGRVRHGYAFGQSMFTPADISLASPPLRDRPYAGWLYAAIGLGVEAGGQLDQFGVSVGVVGPSSLADQSQKFFHRMTGSDYPQGWDTQLGNEPGIVGTYQRSWRELATATRFGTQSDLTPHAGVALGNVFTYANVGLTLRYGRQLPDDYGPPRIQPGLPGSGDFAPAADFGWYLYAGIEGRLVARNIFLDGNTFRDSRSVDKNPLVGDLQVGFALDWPAVRFSYSHVVCTPEFRTQSHDDTFGAVSVSMKF